MKYKYSILTFLFALTSFFMTSAQENTVSIPDMSVGKGKTISMPVVVTNSTDIVAIQFTLTVPDGISINTATATLSERCADHSITMRENGSHKYMAMIYSPTNTPISGNGGNLMTVDLSASTSLEEGVSYPLLLTDVVLARNDGYNMVTGISAGEVAIESSPDLEVSNVSTTSTSIMPGDPISVNWNVTNIGYKPATSGWKTEIFLETANSSKLISTTWQEDVLASSASLSCSADIILPTILSIDGDVKIKVQITSSDEKAGLDHNNSSYSNGTITIGKVLYLNYAEVSVIESEGKTMLYKLSRSGDTSSAESFAIALTPADNRILSDATVTIEAGKSEVYFNVKVTPNGKVDDNESTVLSVAGNGYEEVKSVINIEDDVFPDAGIAFDKEEITEGEEFTITASAYRPVSEDTRVSIVCDTPAGFVIPSEIIIPAGQESVTVKITSKDDSQPDLNREVGFTVTIPNHNKVTDYITVIDNDIPTLSLELTPNAVSEDAGPLSVTAIITRAGNTDKKVSIRLSDNSDGAIYYGRQNIDMEAGVERATVNLGPIDNNLVDGERNIDITAAVYIASCSCAATDMTSGGVVKATLTVFDNDGPVLEMTSQSGVIKEGAENIITVKRNTSTESALTVGIESDHSDNLEYPATVEIPAGETSTSFTVKSIANGITNDGFNVMFTASADGFAKGLTWFTVTDQTLPDAKITSIAASKNEVNAGDEITLEIVVANDGTYELAEGVAVTVYSGNPQSTLATVYTSQSIAPGESLTLTAPVALPNRVGEISLYAVVNENRAAKELTYTNNTSNMANVTAVSPFSVTLSTDKSIYAAGEKVSVSGKLSGAKTSDETIEVYVVNDGARQTITTTSDAEGNFSCDYTPYAGQTGHFSVGACYPGENLRTELAGFDIYGFKRKNSSSISHEVYPDETYSGTLGFVNSGVLDQTNVKATLIDVPEGIAVKISDAEISADGKTYTFRYDITPGRLSSGYNYEKFRIRVTSDEGGSIDTDIYFYSVLRGGKLNSSISRINTTVTKGTPRDYPFTITNIGLGETGKITLSLPSWITTATPKEMASLKHNESAEVVLRINVTDSMLPNILEQGQIAVNCTNANGIVIPFEIMPVTESRGNLTVDVCDEYTYSSDGAHLSNASVKVTHPYTGATVAEGTTDANGKFNAELNGGYYTLTVTADNHDSMQKTIIVDPGKTNIETVNLSIQGVDIDWKVEPTEIEDEYEIVTTVKFQVDVPVPSIELIVPDKLEIENLAEGESMIFNAVLINHGLMAAEDVELLLPDDSDRYQYEALSNLAPFRLAPHQSVQIPIRIVRRIGSATASNPCRILVGTIYYWNCGSDRKWSRYYLSIKVGSCPSSSVGAGGGGSGGGGGGYISGGSGGGYVYIPNGYSNYSYSSYSSPIVKDNDTDCDPCQRNFRYKMTSCFTESMPAISNILEHVDRIDCVTVNSDRKSKVVCLVQQMTTLRSVNEWVEMYKNCILPLFISCDGDTLDAVEIPVVIDKTWFTQRVPDPTAIKGYPSYVQEYLIKLAPLMNGVNAMLEIMCEIAGDNCWYRVSEEELAALIEQLKTWDGTVASLLACKPSNITMEQYTRFLTRLASFYNDNAAESEIDTELIDRCYKEIANLINLSVKYGYGSLSEMFVEETKKVGEGLNEARESVCSTLTLQFSQRMVMTRQAFRGTLKVANGHGSLPIENMTLKLMVTDMDGGIATSHEFEIAPESLDGFEGELSLENGWSLAAGQTGVATVLFIPTKYAAPTEPKDYNFTGFVTYVDPFTGNEVIRELNPVTLTVSPSPNLDLTYFMQRDVIGDDPLTETVEACEEAEFSLLINNTGYGDATNVRMMTQQPKIIQNDKGILLDLELISSQLNGGDKTLALGSEVATDFGTIPAKSTTYAQWWFTSSLLGHFVDYDVKATHLSSYGNPDLSLLGDVTIHELIRSLKVESDEGDMAGFLTNDLVDANDTPDMLYVSNGDILPVATASGCRIEKISNRECRLTVTGAGNGWVYGNVIDPTYGNSKLQSVVRQSDGKNLPTRNFWLTDRTLRDGRDPLYENRIHFADNMTNATETYILTFDEMPTLQLAVVAIEGVPAEGTVASQPVESVNVVFNKHIDPSTFTADDLSLTTQAEQRDTNLIGISTEDNKTFKLDFSALNDTVVNGYYVLTVQTAEITDAEGFKGKDGKQASWVMYFNNLTRLRVTVDPENAGTIHVPNYVADDADPSIRYVAYGDTIDIKAVANRGFDFTGWYMVDECLSNDTVMTRTMVNDLSMIAKFTQRNVNLTIDGNIDGGHITGATSGIYLYGDSIRLTAVQNEDFLFENWIVNGRPAKGNGELMFELNEDTEVSAKFTRDLYSQTFRIYEGWNWISTYLKEPVDVFDFNSRTNRILGQFTESILDPAYGMVGDVENFSAGQSYKIQSNLSFLKTVKGHLHDITENPVALHSGWNWISYPYFEARTLESAVVNPAEGDFMVTQTGFAEYSEGEWQGSLQTLEPGFGYMYKSGADKRIDFDFTDETEENLVAAMRKVVRTSHSDEVDIHRYPNTMNITMAIMADGEELYGPDYTIYAMAGNDCRGVSVYSNDMYYLTVYGDEPVNVSFVVVNETTGETFLGSDSMQFRNDVVGCRKAPYNLNLIGASGVNAVSGESHKIKIFTPSGILIKADADLETIKSLAPGIYIIDGKKVLVK